MDLSFLPSSALGWLNVAGLAVGCASAVAAALSRLTANTVDDRIAARLAWLHDKVAVLGLHPGYEVKQAGTEFVDHKKKP